METDEIQRLTDIEDTHWWFRERRSMLARELRRLGAPGRALDIGTAGGGNSRVLVEHGWSTLATDLNPAAVAIARERGLDAEVADARDLPVDSGSVDLVVASEVLEHVEEHDVVAAEIARVLRPGGVVFVTVPCDMRLWSQHDVAVGHVRRYTRHQLAAVLETAGLRVERLWSWNVLLRPAVVLHRRTSKGSDLVENGRLVNAALRAVVAAERFLPVRNLPGVSLICVARKP